MMHILPSTRDCRKVDDRCGHPGCATCFPGGRIVYNPEADKLAAVLQSIIDSACHPDIALRVIAVDLAPIRKALAEYRKTLSP
jgi:hypothetical protein